METVLIINMMLLILMNVTLLVQTKPYEIIERFDAVKPQMEQRSDGNRANIESTNQDVKRLLVESHELQSQLTRLYESLMRFIDVRTQGSYRLEDAKHDLEESKEQNPGMQLPERFQE